MYAATRAHFDRAAIEVGHHFVHFYDDDLTFGDMLRGYCATGLRRGETVLVIASGKRLAALRRALSAEGDMEGAVRFNRYVPLDAEEVLSRFMVDGMPSAERFAAVMRGILEPGRLEGRRVRSFGEMVAQLWERGETEAALRLEELWNDVTGRYNIMLFCAYPRRLFAGGRITDQDGMDRICRCHTHVLPADIGAA